MQIQFILSEEERFECSKKLSGLSFEPRAVVQNGA